MNSKYCTVNKLSIDIWFPNYCFFIQSILLQYPVCASGSVQKKYYSFFIEYLPEFIPNSYIKKQLIDLYNKYPIQPYLRTKEDINLWFWYITNKLNKILNKKQRTYQDYYSNYFKHYITKNDDKIFIYRKHLKWVLFCLIFLLLIGILIFCIKKKKMV